MVSSALCLRDPWGLSEMDLRKGGGMNYVANDMWHFITCTP